MNTVIIYPGRFQPFHNGHNESFKKLIDKFGAEHAYIATSDKVNNINSPLNFYLKKYIIVNLYPWINSSNIIKTIQPYKPREILENYDLSNTIVIFGVGSNEADKLLNSKFFVEYSDDINFIPYTVGAYIYKLPRVNNASSIRRFFRDKSNTLQQKKEMFISIYQKFDNNIFKVFKTFFK